MTPITFQSLTIGGVVLCVLAVIVSMAVSPQVLAPPTFFIAACVLLALAFWIHRSEFGVEEYERNTLKYTLRNSAAGILLFMVILGIVGYFVFNRFNTPAPSMFGPALPPITTPIVGGGLASVAKNAVSRVKELMRNGVENL